MASQSSKAKRDTPNSSLLRVARAIFEDSNEKEKFLAAVLAGKSSRKAVIVLNESGCCERAPMPDWVPSWVRDQSADDRTAHDRGDLYTLDLSSVFCAVPLTQIPIAKPQILDLCAAPGGKAIFAYRALDPSFLLSNEVIGKRVPILISNFERCNVGGAAVISRDPALLSRDFGGAFDVVVVDAPCSGQSLLARGEGQTGAFHPSTINMNSNRQKRIVAHASQCVRPGGYLLYSTCTFSEEENEGVIHWLQKKFPRFATVPVPALEDYRSTHSISDCYRLFPQNGQGSGGFCALLKAEGESEAAPIDLATFHAMWKRPSGTANS